MLYNLKTHFDYKEDIEINSHAIESITVKGKEKGIIILRMQSGKEYELEIDTEKEKERLIDLNSMI